LIGECRSEPGGQSWPAELGLAISCDKLTQPLVWPAKTIAICSTAGVPITPDHLPDDPAALKRIIAAMAQDALTAQAEIARLKFQLARYRRAEFGRSSEKLAHQAEQLELALEALETDQAERLATASPEVAAAVETAPEAQKPARRPLPQHLPREDQRHPAPCTCPSCGGALRKIADEVSETLDYVPGRFKVIRHIREKLSCRTCDTVVAAPAPDHAIARGRAGAGLLAHIVVSKYDDHLPLYRQAEIFARDGVSLGTSTLCGWVGATAAALKPLVDALATDILGGDTLHVDDTPVPVLAPGTGKTKTGRLWTYVRDERPFTGSRKPAALFCYSPDRKGEHPQAHLKDFHGVIHADGYAGFNELFAGGRIVEAGCWAHVRRKFFDVHIATGSPIAKEALDRIGQLYAVEKIINGLSAERRRQRRQLQSKPIAEALAAWAESTVRQLSRKSELAQAFRYMRARWTALVRCFDDGRLALDNNPAERALRCVAIGRKNYLFAGSDAGGHRAAALYSLIESAKLNGLNPQHYLADVLARIADHPARRIAELLPWNWQPLDATRAAA
jgi:transposase